MHGVALPVSTIHHEVTMRRVPLTISSLLLIIGAVVFVPSRMAAAKGCNCSVTCANGSCECSTEGGTHCVCSCSALDNPACNCR